MENVFEELDIDTEQLILSNLLFSQEVAQNLCCPSCGSAMKEDSQQLCCSQNDCKQCFPIVNQVPILINEEKSIFSIDDFVSGRPTTFNLKENKLKRILSQLLPDIDRNFKANQNYRTIAEMLMSQSGNSKILVIGCGNLGQGMEALATNPSIELVETDVSWGKRTQMICDAHDLPFASDRFDGVIVQAVLEHVVDPHRCVAEIHRVLKKDGVVYAETPFMQQVHMGCFDFTRFTHLGHRRLFRHFSEVDSGAVNGPGSALAWSYQYFLLSFATSKVTRKLIRAFARLTAFYLQYFDYLLLDKPGAFDAAAGYYFIGQKSDHVLSDKELLALYRGGISL
ncbi:MAG: methyltransferase domain-containing protein [Chloroflexi bacterium AL-N5]|nr:methyltransferase domain-containing protein [Chloroflexi bacterium AL-N5]